MLASPAKATPSDPPIIMLLLTGGDLVVVVLLAEGEVSLFNVVQLLESEFSEPVLYN